ncbi:MAG: DUF1564 domain-containing protein [Leptospira sp.]|nr:DUF1564 domain-containing protein [Leptospira sp.]
MLNIDTRKRTQSTLLIPDRFIDDFFNKTDPMGREIFFRTILKRYAPLIRAGVFGERNKVKISYQEKGRDLVRKNFRPFNSDWIEFGILADYIGVSKTELFTMLLVLEISDWPTFLSEKWYVGGVPPTATHVMSITHLKYTIPIRVFRKIRYRTRR